jgi:3-hydroxyisobutyrate dehydrogenase-like beta-hydroxyacid dehydrogenase
VSVLRVGLIGAGRMGEPMARFWLDAGHPVATYDPRPEAARELVARGATHEASPAAVAARSDVIVVLVGYPADVDACMDGDDGVLAGLRPGGIVVVSSTTEPEQVQRLAVAARARGGDLLDAPIARGEPAAHAGNVLWFVGGAAGALERARDVLAACGPDIHHVGDVGAGQVAKAINNMLLWAAVVSNREGFALAAAFGVDEERLRAALLDSSAASWAMAHWSMMDRTPWAHKDLVLTTAMADQAGLSLPVTGLLRECVKERWTERAVELPSPGAARRAVRETR